MSYWVDRQNLEYYTVVRQWLEDMLDQDCLLDIGCHDTPVATWGTFRRRYTIDPLNRPALIAVHNIVGLWPQCRAFVPPPVSVITCLQVLEHLSDPGPFCREMFAAADRAVILSVPLNWPVGQQPGHKQDPVTKERLRGWTNRDPSLWYVTGEKDWPRAVALYDVGGDQRIEV